MAAAASLEKGEELLADGDALLIVREMAVVSGSGEEGDAGNYFVSKTHFGFPSIFFY